MTKRFNLLLAAGALLAFAVLAFANAVPAVTQPAGTLLTTGSSIVGTSTVIETELGELSCTSTVIEVLLVEHSGRNVLGWSLGGALETLGCLLENEDPVSLTEVKWTMLSATSLTKTIALTFKAMLPGGVECTFSGTVPFTYTAGGSPIHIGGALSGGACGSATISGDYSLEHSGSAVIPD